MKGEKPVYPEEHPALRVHVDAFEIQAHEVTNDQFAAFVEESGFVTDAERISRADGLRNGSAVFQYHTDRTDSLKSWSFMRGANWRQPKGDGSSVSGLGSHPVVHISKRDAEAYATWAGGRLPTEIEWEYVARFDLRDASNPSSGAYKNGRAIANTWQGIFPLADEGTDGFRGSSPVGCFAPNFVGTYDMIGNVWEWTSTPYGQGTHTIKGGSFLCSENFCRRYRPAARQPQETDFSSNHIGFRIVRDAE